MKKRILMLLACITAAATAAPQPDLWQRWETHGNGAEISHAAWSQFLSEHLAAPGKDGVARLDYAAAANDADARASLKDYLADMADAPVDDMTRDEQLAYWINLYNALTVDLILENYPVDSIRDISDGLFSAGPWDRKIFTVAGEELSLNDIEHRILRPIWNDARIHYAVNCASIGCPNLAATAFTATNSEELLTNGAHAYINNPRGAQVKDGKLTVSSIYEWFKDDFGGDDAGVIAHLKEYADESLQTQLEKITKISDDEYDWSLNATQ